MTPKEHTHVETAQLGVIVRDLTEAVQIQGRELQRLASLLEQQTDLRDQPKDLSVATSSLAALHHQASQLAERLEERVQRE